MEAVMPEPNVGTLLEVANVIAARVDSNSWGTLVLTSTNAKTQIFAIEALQLVATTWEVTSVYVSTDSPRLATSVSTLTNARGAPTIAPTMAGARTRLERSNARAMMASLATVSFAATKTNVRLAAINVMAWLHAQTTLAVLVAPAKLDSLATAKTVSTLTNVTTPPTVIRMSQFAPTMSAVFRALAKKDSERTTQVSVKMLTNAQVQRTTVLTRPLVQTLSAASHVNAMVDCKAMENRAPTSTNAQTTMEDVIVGRPHVSMSREVTCVNVKLASK